MDGSANAGTLRDELLGRPCLEPAVPELLTLFAGAGVAVRHQLDDPGPWMPDQVCTPRPQMRTKPSESACRNRSAAS